MEWGDHLEHLLALHETGVKVKALENRPVLLPGLQFYVDGFRELQSDRRVEGFGLGPIPWSSIVNWCRLHGIHDISDIDTTVRYFRAMENAEYTQREKKKK